jgi:hypothetical protein
VAAALRWLDDLFLLLFLFGFVFEIGFQLFELVGELLEERHVWVVVSVFEENGKRER